MERFKGAPFINIWGPFALLDALNKWMIHINEFMQEMAKMLMHWSDVREKVHWPQICVLLLRLCS